MTSLLITILHSWLKLLNAKNGVRYIGNWSKPAAVEWLALINAGAKVETLITAATTALITLSDSAHNTLDSLASELLLFDAGEIDKLSKPTYPMR